MSQYDNSGCTGVQKAVETYIKGLFEARNAAHNLMVELYECPGGNTELGSKVSDKITIYDSEAQAVADLLPCVFKTTDPEVIEFLEVMGVIS
jgi:hypothetical protein